MSAPSHPPQPAPTLIEVLRGAADYLARNGVESPRLNAEHLVAHVLSKRRLDLYLEFDRPMSEAERAPLRDLVRRRGKGEPLQHLLGTVEFLGRSFVCDRRALVPRPETEMLCDLLTRDPTLRPTPAGPARFADVGTGSGVIALSLAAAFPEAEVIATDSSPDALALAAANAERLGLAGRVRWIPGDLLAGQPGPFDLIAANLPYIPSHAIPSLSREVRHDPPAALDGGPDGTGPVRRLIDAAPAALAPGGLLALEIGEGQSDCLIDILRARGYSRVEGRLDLNQHIRFLFARHG